MLSWLKRRAKVTINNRYINIFRSNITTNMFVSEPTVSLINDHNLKLTVFNTEGHEYPLEISSITTVERVKVMAVGHFYPFQEAVGATDDRPGGVTDGKGNGNRTYRLVVLRGARPLSDGNPLHFEKLIDNDVLLLVERREPPPQLQDSSDENSSPSKQQISTLTAHVPKRNDNRDPDPANASADFQTEFRRILVTMIEASVRLISADPDSKEVFTQILDKLERRHRPRVDRIALRQLTEMGFVESKATKALQVKRNFNEAVEWLLEDGISDDPEVKNGDEVGSLSSDSSVEKNSLEDQQEDPAKKILKQFLQYRRKWFQPNQQAVQRLSQLGYQAEKIIEVLRVTGNNENAAREILVDEKVIPPDDQGLERDSPIISAILASPVIQLALPKPKTLLALMMLFESPNNANMWLSDPDTHPVVSQVLRIYHAEKHSLNHGRAVPASAGTTQTSVDSNMAPDYNRAFPRSNTPPRNNSSSGNPYTVRSENQPQPFHPNYYHVRSASNGSFGSDHVNLHVTSTSPLLPMRGVSPNSSPIPASRADTLPNSALALSQQGQISSEEPMSHSGSPVRAMVGIHTGSSMANGGPQQMTISYPCSNHLLQNPPTDFEMDETGQDSQEMETQ